MFAQGHIDSFVMLASFKWRKTATTA